MDYELTRPTSRTLPLQHLEKLEEPYKNNIVVVTDSKSVYELLKKGQVLGRDEGIHLFM